MLETVIQGGTVVDGTGAPGQQADVAIDKGRIVAIGAVDERADHTIDADGLVVAPGFVDIHTHYDAQAFWDPMLSPSPQHGVTTVVGGNCGFTIAPLEESEADYLLTMLARVEGMPVESLQQGVPWDWRTTAEYLDRLDGTLAPNAGFLVGHCALRRVVMGADAVGHEADEAQLEAMEQLLHDGLAAGGLGFSSSWAATHNDADGEPVPSRHATEEEMLRLCAVVSEHPGTTLEFIPTVGPFDDEHKRLMTEMSLAANRPLNWNVLVHSAGGAEATEAKLSAGDYAAERGAKVVALTVPDLMRIRLSFDSGFVFDALPGWRKPMALPPEEKMALLSDPDRRRELDASANSEEAGLLRGIAHWKTKTIAETFAPENEGFEGRTVGDIAAELGKEPFDALCDIVVADELRTSITPGTSGDDDVSWKERTELWRDPRVVLGASDAGAHLDMIATFNYSTALLGDSVRDRGLLEVEEAVHLITDVQARLYGLRERGRLAEEWHADICVFDPATVGPGEVHTRFDLPGGAGRLYSEGDGIEHVLVGGEAIIDNGSTTEARPGTLLRSGRDTETVTVPGG